MKIFSIRLRGHLVKYIVSSLFLLLFIKYVAASGFAFRNGQFGIVYTSSNTMFDNIPRNWLSSSLTSQPSINGSLRPYIVPYIVHYPNSGVDKMCNAIVLGGTSYGDFPYNNRLWVLSAASCLQGNAPPNAMSNPQIGDIRLPINFPPLSALGNYFFSWWLVGIGAYNYNYNLENVTDLMPSFREISPNFRNYRNGLVLFEVAQDNLISPIVALNNQTTFHLQVGLAAPGYERFIASWGELTVGRDANIVGELSNATTTKGGGMVLTTTYVDGASPAFINALGQTRPDININMYHSYSCFGDLGGGIFQNNSIVRNRTVLSGVVTFGDGDFNSGYALHGLCYTVGGDQSIQTRVLHDFNQGDIDWILNVTGLVNIP